MAAACVEVLFDAKPAPLGIWALFLSHTLLPSVKKIRFPHSSDMVAEPSPVFKGPTEVDGGIVKKEALQLIPKNQLAPNIGLQMAGSESTIVKDCETVSVHKESGLRATCVMVL